MSVINRMESDAYCKRVVLRFNDLINNRAPLHKLLAELKEWDFTAEEMTVLIAEDFAQQPADTKRRLAIIAFNGHWSMRAIRNGGAMDVYATIKRDGAYVRRHGRYYKLAIEEVGDNAFFVNVHGLGSDSIFTCRLRQFHSAASLKGGVTVYLGRNYTTGVESDE